MILIRPFGCAWRFRPVIRPGGDRRVTGMRFRMTEMRMVEMDVTARYRELEHQRGEREVRPPSLAQPEPAHRDAIPLEIGSAIACRPSGTLARMLYCNNMRSGDSAALLHEVNRRALLEYMSAECSETR